MTPEGASGASFILEEGLSAFNRGDYFEAHEIWEDLWRGSSGPEKSLLQGLIQASVGLYHVQKGKAPAGLRAAAKALKNLQAGEGASLVDSAPVKAWLENWLQERRPATPPTLEALKHEA